MIIQSNAIKGDSLKGENFRKIRNELIIFPYITIIERAINRENLRKFQNKFFPLNGVRLYNFKNIIKARSLRSDIDYEPWQAQLRHVRGLVQDGVLLFDVFLLPVFNDLRSHYLLKNYIHTHTCESTLKSPWKNTKRKMP